MFSTWTVHVCVIEVLFYCNGDGCSCDNVGNYTGQENHHENSDPAMPA